MSESRWREAWALFERAVELPAEQRAAFLDEHFLVEHGSDEHGSNEHGAAERASLRRTVERLLQADDAEAPFDEPLLRLSTTEAVKRPEGATTNPVGDPPRRIGPYDIVRQIGQGGMGTVYLASRSDDTFARQVVIKVVRRGLESARIQERLRIERQILAGLEHPHIARLYDGGTTEGGMPYFVLEYVEGTPIDAHCDDQQLDVRERLDLFRKVCGAVHHAHQNLVVHRDLKPSNILVTGGGEPKLLDFGIAKLLSPIQSATSQEPTATWHRMMTPSYASPEQLLGQPISTASDVYALGVLLYKLLTGRLPRDLGERSPAEIERLLLDQEPLPPSAAVAQADPDKHLLPRPVEPGRRLAGDLDAIVMKALRVTPRQRYGSAEALAEDIERHGLGLPVQARRGSWRYRTGKFLGRHRTASALAAVVLLLTLLFAAALARQAARIVEERDAAILERNRKDQVADLILEMLEAADPWVAPGEQLSARDALVRGSALIERRLVEQPEVRAELLRSSGSLLGRLGDQETAGRQLEEALALLRRQHAGPHLDVARTLQALAAVNKELGSPEGLDLALERAEEAVAMMDRLPDPPSRDRLEALVELIRVHCFRNEHQRAQDHATEVMALIDALPDGSRHGIAAYQWVAVVRSNTGDYETAVELYRKALALHRRAYGEDHPLQVRLLNNLGLALRRSNAFEAAERSYTEALAILAKSFPEGHPDAVVLVENIAGSLHGQERYREAIERYHEAIDLARGFSGAGSYRELRIELRRARPRLALGEGEAVEESVRRTLGRLRALGLPDEHWLYAEGQGLIGVSLMNRERLDEAEPLLLESFHRLVASARQRYKSDALERLRILYEARGTPGALEPLAAMIEPNES